MKRISLFAAVLLLMTTSLTTGRGYYHGSWYPGVRWSMHAHGLVPNYLRYSPYAHTYGHSGLVPYWVRYSPYAHSYNHRSGLVNDYAFCMDSIYYDPDTGIYKGASEIHSDCSQVVKDTASKIAEIKQTRENQIAKIKARKEEIQQLAQSRKLKRLTDENNGKEIIIAYLKDNHIDFRMNRLLSMEGKVLSADFILGDGRKVISFWNPVEIQALSQQAEHRRLTYQKYVNSWKDFCVKYQQAGGEIVQIVSADREEILAQLTGCDECSGTQTTYAMAQTEPQP
ncbi:MAG: hypothetical protein JXM79_14680 [Sedimentisphaerales bacterium]|nr:hypothetical protein [Sedimentisphaerales bacterium]